MRNKRVRKMRGSLRGALRTSRERQRAVFRGTIGTVEQLEPRRLLSTTWYVDAGASGATHDGASWTSAYTDLQQALASAVADVPPAVLAADINVALNSGSSPGQIVPADGFVYFVPLLGPSPGELWRSDGTPEGTHLVKEIITGGKGPVITSPTYVDGTLYFIARDETHGMELWKSDGTEAGTVMVKDVAPGDGAYSPLAVVGNTVYFRGHDSNGYELWKSDGTEAGTVMVKDITPGGLTFLSSMVSYGGMLYFAAKSQTNSPGPQELWRSDGTGEGTVKLSSGIDDVANLCVAGDTLYFTGSTSTSGNELYRSNGSAVSMVSDINPGTSSSNPLNLTTFGGKVCFRAFDGPYGDEPWISDGTEAGTFMLKDVLAGSGSSGGGYNQPRMVSCGASLYFVALDSAHGEELWKTDGTSAGTQLVADIAPGSTSGVVSTGVSIGGLFYFSASDGVHGTEPWVTDGSPEGTRMISDIDPGVSGSSPDGFKALGGTVYFAADDGSIGTELWRIGPPAHATARDMGDGRILVEGTADADSISFSTDSGQVTITLPGNDVRSFDAAQVRSIVFDGYGGGDSINLDAGAAVLLDRPQELVSLSLDAGTLKLSGGVTLATAAMSIAGGGSLDLGEGALIVSNANLGSWNGSAYTGISGLLQSGVIFSSSAQNRSTGLGAATASSLFGISGAQTATFDGQTVSPSDVLIKFTYVGDANLDGKVNIDDYGRIDANVGQSGSVFGWYAGDFNLDGKINIDDYGLIDSIIGAQGPVL